MKPRKSESDKQNNFRGLDKYLIFSFSMIVIFTIVQTVITLKTGVEQSTLITCFFSVFGGETVLCAVIKRFKLKDENDGNEESEDNGNG
jgi:hypothetical protein